MRILMYLLTAILGLLGLAGVLRFIERIAFGAEGSGSPFVQLVLGLVFLLLASKILAKARDRSISDAASTRG